MVKSYLRGHAIEYVNDQWKYSDTKELTAETHHLRSCGYCHKKATPEGHDACLGTLPNVMNACCGHGETNEAYAQYWDKSIIRGVEAIKTFEVLKGESKCLNLNCQ
ncbi:hypothetical protein CIL05_07660 [Virgibacillus profundi]|uniref:Uncharacterized protein n=1 Tax=Virgibacillus profundi TaxID=2024555 RepID=A0A2A2IG46_9BACI|nr:hypothetical protein [Virgibacillus profundi]PAV30338.1 hypothetical protein CIL05_07660 [Virgibacillus profundi]PXY54510.1 hypothetical protein CIT14_07745 [Virgibacillus profundi]